MRFAFYSRISTDGYQDPASSRQWQFDIAAELADGRGIAVEFFDAGYSRSLPWRERPEAFRKGVVARIPPFKTDSAA